MKKVSVVLPVYNVERYIAEAVESVLAQTHANFELLIIDDGSPDRSIEICERYQDPRIRILRQKNRGLAGARNTGIRHATGEYLAFLDSDDTWMPHKLARHVEHLDFSPAVGLSYCQSAFIDEQSQPLGTYQLPKLSGITTAHLLCRNPVGNGSAPVIRRKALDEIRYQADYHGQVEDFYFDEELRQSEDIECWIRISSQTDWQLEGIAEPLTCYRVNGGGLSANLTRQLETWERVIEKTRAYAPEVVAQSGNLARAYQLRYLARRAVRSQDALQAVAFVHRALATDPRILTEEPQRTLLTLVAAYLLTILPRPLYTKLEHRAMQPLAARPRLAS